jgi:hypothetical protein
MTPTAPTPMTMESLQRTLYGCFPDDAEGYAERRKEQDAFLAVILQAVNSHAALVVLLSRCLGAVKIWQREQNDTHPWMVDGWKLQEDIEAALALARQE